MRSCREPSGRKCPDRRAALIGAAMMVLLAMPAPVRADGNSPGTAVLTEFNAICEELSLARGLLAQGDLPDDDFANTSLALFVRADTLATTVGDGSQRANRDLPTFALQKGVVYLIESLRENYVGIVGRNGVSFVEADQALKAAVAWRSGALSLAAAPK